MVLLMRKRGLPPSVFTKSNESPPIEVGGALWLDTLRLEQSSSQRCFEAIIQWLLGVAQVEKRQTPCQRLNCKGGHRQSQAEFKNQGWYARKRRSINLVFSAS